MTATLKPREGRQNLVRQPTECEPRPFPQPPPQGLRPGLLHAAPDGASAT